MYRQRGPTYAPALVSHRAVTSTAPTHIQHQCSRPSIANTIPTASAAHHAATALIWADVSLKAHSRHSAPSGLGSIDIGSSSRRSSIGVSVCSFAPRATECRTRSSCVNPRSRRAASSFPLARASASKAERLQSACHLRRSQCRTPTAFVDDGGRWSTIAHNWTSGPPGWGTR